MITNVTITIIITITITSDCFLIFRYLILNQLK